MASSLLLTGSVPHFSGSQILPSLHLKLAGMNPLVFKAGLWKAILGLFSVVPLVVALPQPVTAMTSSATLAVVRCRIPTLDAPLSGLSKSPLGPGRVERERIVHARGSQRIHSECFRFRGAAAVNSFAHQHAEHRLVDAGAVGGLADTHVLAPSGHRSNRRVSLDRVRDQPEALHALRGRE